MLTALAQTDEVAAVQVPKRVSVETERMRRWLDEHVAAGNPRKPLAEIVTLTPVLAGLLLERNPINRPISHGNSSALLSDIANNRFVFNGEPIVVSDSGVLLDGQHRCQAVIQANKPIQTLIVFGPKEEARFTIDIGRPKSAPNFLHMKGFKNTAVLAAAARMLLVYRERKNLITGGAKANFTPPTKTEVLDAVEQFRGLERSVETAMQAPAHLGGRSVIAFTHYVISRKAGVEATDAFFQKMFDGTDLSRGNPILYCAKRLSTLTVNGGGAQNVRAELIFKSWNAHRRGEMVDKMPLNGRLPGIER